MDKDFKEKICTALNSYPTMESIMANTGKTRVVLTRNGGQFSISYVRDAFGEPHILRAIKRYLVQPMRSNT